MELILSDLFGSHKISGIPYLELNKVDGALESVITDIINGDACEIRAMEVAMFFIEDAMELYQEAQDVTDKFIKDCEDYEGSMDSAWNLMKQATEKMRSILSVFHHYPHIIRTAHSMHELLVYYTAYMIVPVISGIKMEDGETKSVSTYFFKNPTTGLVKIGRSNDVKTRKQAVQCGSGVELDILLVIDGDIERELHKKFAKYQEHGEWFNDADGKIAAYIAKRN